MIENNKRALHDRVVDINPIYSAPHRFEWQNLMYCYLDILFTSLTHFPLPNNLLPSLPLSRLPNVHIPRAQKCWVLLFSLHTDFFSRWVCKLSPNICSRESCKAEEKQELWDALCTCSSLRMCCIYFFVQPLTTNKWVFYIVKKEIKHRGGNKSDKEIERGLGNTMPLSNKPLFWEASIIFRCSTEIWKGC